VFFVVSVVSGAESNRQEVVEFRLNYEQIFKVNTYLSRGVTTVMFPGAIEGIAAGNVALNKVTYNADGTPVCDFLMSFQPGNYYFSLRALKANATGSLNIIYGRKNYIVKLQENEKSAMSTVIFKDVVDDLQSGNNFRSTNPAVLKGLIDKAKVYDLLKEKHSDALADVQFSDRKSISEYDNYVANVVRTWRFDKYDSLVFMVVLKNKTKKTLVYKPIETAVAVLGKKFYASLVDASGVMPPDSTSIMFFAITGTPNGRHNYLAPDNNWKVLINAVGKGG
jgi:hypothetical protein